MELDILVKLAEKQFFAMQSFVVHQVYHLELWSEYHRNVLADRLFAAKKISASVADNPKYQFMSF